MSAESAYIMRPPSDAFGRAISKHPEAHLIDVDEALAQHAAFADRLRSAGAHVVMLPPHPELPDAPFVQDTMITFAAPHDPLGRSVLLVATRPGATSRRPEVASVIERARSLVDPGCQILQIEEPGTMDGGDVLVWGDRVVIGISHRTDLHGARQLKTAVEALGYRAWLCPVSDDRLHFASAITVVSPTRLIGTAVGFHDLDAVDSAIAPADEMDRVVIPDRELPAHNVVRVGDTVFIPAGNPESVAMLRQRGETVVEVVFHQFTRADAGLTCLIGVVR